jgi:pimeloyl-ACP methyl ester carboxylesterase
VHIAYQVVGNGPRDIVYVPGFISHLDLYWESPRLARGLGRLSSFARLILFDKRGTGLSDRMGAMPTLEERMDDVRAVMDAVASKQAGLIGNSEGGPLSILFAATYPQRSSALVLCGSYARRMWAPDCPWGRTEEQFDEFLKLVEEKWEQGDALARYFDPNRISAEYKRFLGRVERLSTHTAAGQVSASSAVSGGSRWPGTIRIRQHASFTTAEPAVAVARNQVIDRVAYHSWDEVKDPCPLPTRKLARNAQHGFGFYIAFPLLHKRKGIRAIRIDTELLSERTSLGHLDWDEAKMAAAITLAHEATAARA